MTLVLTEITQLGIAMAADSAVTMSRQLSVNRTITRVLTGVQKLQYIPRLNAGISCWGHGNIGLLPMDVWLNDFIHDPNNQYSSLEEFATLLVIELRQEFPRLADPTSEQLRFGTVGFHLAGISEYRGKMMPDFWHIHNGRSESLERRGTEIDPYVINANHDVPPELMASLPENALQLVRNGDFQIYANLIGLLHSYFEVAKKEYNVTFGFTRPILSDRCEWLKFQIELIANLYSFSNLLPTIGGDISYLWISTDGSHGINIPDLRINVSEAS